MSAYIVKAYHTREELKFFIKPDGGLTSDRQNSAVFLSPENAKQFAESVKIHREYRLTVEAY